MKLNVLILEDNPSDAELMLHELRKEGYDPTWDRVDSEPRYREILNPEYDIILSDYSMPQFNALKALEILQEQPFSLPFVVVTGSVGEEIAVQMIKQGADDYLLKDRLARLGPAVTKALREHKLGLQNRQAQEALIANEARYRTIFNGVMDALLVETPTGEILDVNQKACEIFGYSRNEFKTKRVRDLVPDEYQDKVPSPENPFIRQEDDLIETINLRANGERFPVEISMQHQVIDNQELLLVVLRDISERKQREKKLQLQLKETTALHHIATISTLETSEDAIIEEATQAIADVLDPDFFGVLLLDQAQKTVKVHPSYRNLPPEHLEAEFPIGEGITGKTAQTGESMYIPDVRATEHFKEIVPGIRSELCVPIKIKNNVLGVINIEDQKQDAFTEDDKRLLSTLAGQLAISIQRARLFKTIEQQVSRLQTLRSIDRTISSSLDINVTLNILLEHTLTQLGVDAACILLLEPNSKTLQFKAEKGFQTRLPLQNHLLIGQGYAGQAVVKNQPIHVPDLELEPGGFEDSRILTDERFRFYYAIPLNFKGKIQGVLELYHRTSKGINQDWKNFAETLAGQAAIAIDNAEMFEELQSANLELSRAYDSTLEGWARALEMRDKDTEGHSKRVVHRTLQLAKELGIPDQQMIHIRRGALLHDIGKIAVPDHILLKTDPLTDQEWEEIRKHPQYAKNMLSPISYLEDALDIPLYHHERWDGSGYPEGLEKHQIPFPARIFAVVDVWDALRRDRPYRKAWSDTRAREHIQTNAGVLFDPRVVEAFLKLIER